MDGLQRVSDAFTVKLIVKPFDEDEVLTAPPPTEDTARVMKLREP